MGCILPWKTSGNSYIPDDGSEELIKDQRGTSCFVIRFGTPGEQIVKELWDHDRRLVFASSANPSGKGPDATADTRYEQSVMVSFVDENGRLVPEQNKQRSVTPAPTLIRAGLSLPQILVNLSTQFPSWDYRHGQYY